LETLAIVAYRQPIVKAEIESIRGVDVSAPLKGLLEKKLIRIVGRKDVPGKPIIYGTTKKFLEVFNLKDLSELPTLRELKEISHSSETT
jgi:segregation and condensation protein B